MRLHSFPATAAAVVIGVTLAPTASADPVERFFEESTNVSCSTVLEDGTFVEFAVNHSEGTEGSNLFANVEVRSADDELIMEGSINELVLQDGTIAAVVPLTDENSVPVGTAVLEGQYEPAAEPTVLHLHPLRIEGNVHLIPTTTFTPLAVQWQTVVIGDLVFVEDGQTHIDANCDGYHQIRSDRMTAPHRISVSFEGYTLPEECSAPPLNEFQVLGSDAGLSLAFTALGFHGETNLDVRDRGPQGVTWFGPAGNEVDTMISAELEKAGTPTTETTTEPGRTVRTTTRPFIVEFTLGLPDGSTMTGACRVDRVNEHFATEPQD